MINVEDWNKERTCHWDDELVCTNNMMCGACKHQPADEDKPNGKKNPVNVDWQIDYGMKMPYCPSCGEMAYSSDRCVFCGQKFIEEEEPQNKKEIIGATVDKDGNTTCDKCGGDKFSLVSHSDGADHFSYDYKCAKCGNRVKVKTYLGQFE